MEQEEKARRALEEIPPKISVKKEMETPQNGNLLDVYACMAVST